MHVGRVGCREGLRDTKHSKDVDMCALGSGSMAALKVDKTIWYECRDGCCKCG